MPAARLELTWPNKDKFLLVPKDEDGKPVWVERDHPAAAEVRIHDFHQAVGHVDDANPYGDNLLFTGDSLDVLRILAEVPEFRREYRGKVKLIYIDPPFNTGETFTDYDDWMEHSTWLSFMRDRLVLAKELLAPDGSIWVHLDDAEQHRMLMLLDEVFGPRNFVGTIVWQKADSPRMDASSLSVSHDFLSVYRKSDAFRMGKFVIEGAQDHYDRTDERGRRYYTKPLRYGGQGDRREDRPNLYFPIVAPDGSEVFPRRQDGSDGRWRWSQSKVEDEQDRLDWTRGRGGSWVPYYRIYAEATTEIPAQTVWGHHEVGSNRTSAAESKALFGGGKFATPKPERLLGRVIELASSPGDIVVDVFGGSGTTAAVAHKMGRRWVTCEVLPETVATFTQPRLAKVVAGEDGGGITESADWTGGGGFRTVTVGPTMYEVTPVGVLLADWATNGRFARAVAGQLGFEWQSKRHAPFCGVRGRMRLAVLDGAVGEEEVRQIVSALGEKERVTVVAKSVLPGSEELLTKVSPGSKVRKAPRDVLAPARARRTRKAVA